jgi:hypothetical protein
LISMSAARDRVSQFLAALDADTREVAEGQWGLVLDAAGYTLDVGVAIRGPLLRAQAAVLPAGVIDPHQLLYWNRQAPLVCFAENQAGEVFVCGELPLASATRAREFAIRHT